jgi:hypothetical protein
VLGGAPNYRTKRTVTVTVTLPPDVQRLSSPARTESAAPALFPGKYRRLRPLSRVDARSGRLFGAHTVALTLRRRTPQYGSEAARVSLQPGYVRRFEARLYQREKREHRDRSRYQSRRGVPEFRHGAASERRAK